MSLTNFLLYVMVPAFLIIFLEAQANQRHSMHAWWGEDTSLLQIHGYQGLEAVIQGTVCSCCNVSGCFRSGHSVSAPGDCFSLEAEGVLGIVPSFSIEVMLHLSWFFFKCTARGQDHIPLCLWTCSKLYNPTCNFRCIHTSKRGQASLKHFIYVFQRGTVNSTADDVI